MHFVCPQCKVVYGAETMEIPMLGIRVQCPDCDYRMFLPRVPVVDAQLCQTCGHMQMIQEQAEGLNSSTECPKCGELYPKSN